MIITLSSGTQVDVKEVTSISAAEARRRLSPGTVIRAEFLRGQYQIGSARIVLKQTAKTMVSRILDGEYANQNVYLDWHGVTITVDQSGGMILTQLGTPFVRFTILEKGV